MLTGRYLYCILDEAIQRDFGHIGIGKNLVYTIPRKDMAAVVSNAPIKKIEPTITELTIHQQVVEAARATSTVLPVRFGTIIKNHDGVTELLNSSYSEFRSKILKLRGLDEFGIKIILEKGTMKKIAAQAKEETPEAKKLAKQMSSSKKGTAYLLKLKHEDLIRKETMKKIDEICGEIHKRLSKVAKDSCLLQTDLERIILNASYLIDRQRILEFNSQIEQLEEKYRYQGLGFHVGGPWAPFSFC